jgi:cytochrome c biogenesis protein CcmG, thiol:disulfide interchange protein DsbE
LPTKDKLFREFKENGLAVLAISFKESEELVKDFQQEFKLSFPVLYDPKGKSAEEYEVTGHPVTYLIDRKGFLIGKVIGERDWSSSDAEAVVRELLKVKP